MEIQLDKIKLIANQIVELYRKQLESKGIPASGALGDTASVEVEMNGTKLVVSLNLEHYWKNVEFGRRPGKMPPIDNIKDWIRVKPVIPDARTGKIPSAEQLAFMIARKIGIEGIPAKKPLEQTGLVYTYTDGTHGFAEATDLFIDAIKAEIVSQLKQQLLD